VDGVNPQTQSPVVAFRRTHDNRSEFGLVARFQQVQVEVLGSGQVFHILNIDLEVSRQFAEDEIVRIQNEEPQVPKLLWEDLSQAIFVALRNAGDSDHLQEDSVFPVQGTAFSGQLGQPRFRCVWFDFDDVDSPVGLSSP
jgi:hypothetical protein